MFRFLRERTETDKGRGGGRVDGSGGCGNARDVRCVLWGRANRKGDW